MNELFNHFCESVFYCMSAKRCSYDEAFDIISSWGTYKSLDIEHCMKSYGLKSPKDVFCYGGKLLGRFDAF